MPDPTEPTNLQELIEELKAGPHLVPVLTTELEVSLELEGATHAGLVLCLADGPEAPDSSTLADLWGCRAREALAQDVKDTSERGRVRALLQALLVYAKADEAAGAKWAAWPVALWFAPERVRPGRVVLAPPHRVWVRYSVREDAEADEGAPG